MYLAEWAPACSCALGQRMDNGMRPIFFTTEAEAVQYWLTMRSGNNPFFAAHARGKGHLLTVHVPRVCLCSGCTPECYV